jgi:hypothetical protein
MLTCLFTIITVILLILGRSGVLTYLYRPVPFSEGIIPFLMSERLLVVVALLTVGLICKFADKKDEKPKDE